MVSARLRARRYPVWRVQRHSRYSGPPTSAGAWRKLTQTSAAGEAIINTEKATVSSRTTTAPPTFVHVTEVQDAGMSTLLADQRISFDLAMGRKGQSKAVNPRLL